jgi:hypothetical protein
VGEGNHADVVGVTGSIFILVRRTFLFFLALISCQAPIHGGSASGVDFNCLEGIMKVVKIVGIAILAATIGRFAYGLCCSTVVQHPNGQTHQLTRYIVTDKWAHCTNGGQIRIWIAANAFVAHAWIQNAESHGHCVLY